MKGLRCFDYAQYKFTDNDLRRKKNVNPKTKSQVIEPCFPLLGSCFQRSGIGNKLQIAIYDQIKYFNPKTKFKLSSTKVLIHLSSY